MYVIAAVGALWVVVWAAADDGLGIRSWWFLALSVLLIVVGFVAARLTVAVDETSVTAAFGWGWPRRRIRLDTIVGAAQVRNSWWHGWGVRKVRRGWMFNNAGRDAIELTLRTGKVFRVGTDQPTELLAAVEHARRAS